MRIKKSFAFLPIRLDSGKWIWFKKYNKLQTLSVGTGWSGSHLRGTLRDYNYTYIETIKKTELDINPYNKYIEEESARISKMNDKGSLTLSQFVYGEHKYPKLVE